MKSLELYEWEIKFTSLKKNVEMGEVYEVYEV